MAFDWLLVQSCLLGTLVLGSDGDAGRRAACWTPGELTGYVSGSCNGGFYDYEIEDPETGAVFKLNMHDMKGQERFAMLRKLDYIDADIAIFAFDLTRPTSLENITAGYTGLYQEFTEAREVGTGSNIILVGTKSDLPWVCTMDDILKVTY